MEIRIITRTLAATARVSNILVAFTTIPTRRIIPLTATPRPLAVMASPTPRPTRGPVRSAAMIMAAKAEAILRAAARALVVARGAVASAAGAAHMVAEAVGLTVAAGTAAN